MCFVGFEYQWLYPTGLFRREFQSTKDLKFVRQHLPDKINDLIDEGVTSNIIVKSNQVHYFILNPNARELKHD